MSWSTKMLWHGCMEVAPSGLWAPVASHQCWSLLLVLSLVLRGFSPGTQVSAHLNQEWLMKNHYVDVLLLNCYLFIYSFTYPSIYLFIYYNIINWLLVKHSFLTSDFSESPGHLVDPCVGWGGMVLMSWSGWRRRKGVSKMYCTLINVWMGRVDCMVKGVAFAFFAFFFFGGGGQISDSWAWKIIQML